MSQLYDIIVSPAAAALALTLAAIGGVIGWAIWKETRRARAMAAEPPAIRRNPAEDAAGWTP